MSTRTTAGTTLKVSASQPATYDAAGYNALNPTLVGEVVNFGEFGRVYNLVTHNPVSSRGTVKKKGSFNEGAMNLQLGLDTDDAGQILMQAAALSDADYTFLITTQNGDKYYFQAQVMGWKINLGGVDQISAAAASIELTTTSAGVGIVPVMAA